MLHLRVIAPTELSGPVIDLLSGNPGVTHLVVHRDAAREPEGDAITADIARESANDVVDELKALGLKERGAITLEALDTVLSTRAYRAEDEAEGEPADAVIWDELVSRTREESTLTATYLTFLCIACMIAAVGVVTDSPATIVGAMVVGPEFGPLAALAVAAVFTLAIEALGWATLQSTDELSEVDFIFQVGPFSFVIALLAGAAGMLSLVSAKSEALVGVFISVTTVPAAGFAVVAATVGDWDVAAQSAAQLGVNLIGITMAGVLVLWVYQRAPTR